LMYKTSKAAPYEEAVQGLNTTDGIQDEAHADSAAAAGRAPRLCKGTSAFRRPDGGTYPHR
jgi:hypothetical protein